MKLKFEGQIATGKLEIYEEHDMIYPAYLVDVVTEDKEHFKMKVSDKNGDNIGEVLYKEDMNRKFLMVNNYIIDYFEKNKQIYARVERGKQIFFGENDVMYLKRSVRDRKMCLYKGNKLLMVLKCKTFIRNWIRGEYVAEILDENYASFCVFVIVIALNVIFDEHNCTSFNL